jgi:hypothetical protein
VWVGDYNPVDWHNQVLPTGTRELSTAVSLLDGAINSDKQWSNLPSTAASASGFNDMPRALLGYMRQHTDEVSAQKRFSNNAPSKLALELVTRNFLPGPADNSVLRGCHVEATAGIERITTRAGMFPHSINQLPAAVTIYACAATGPAMTHKLTENRLWPGDAAQAINVAPGTLAAAVTREHIGPGLPWIIVPTGGYSPIELVWAAISEMEYPFIELYNNNATVTAVSDGSSQYAINDATSHKSIGTEDFDIVPNRVYIPGGRPIEATTSVYELYVTFTVPVLADTAAVGSITTTMPDGTVVTDAAWVDVTDTFRETYIGATLPATTQDYEVSDSIWSVMNTMASSGLCSEIDVRRAFQVASEFARAYMPAEAWGDKANGTVMAPTRLIGTHLYVAPADGWNGNQWSQAYLPAVPTGSVASDTTLVTTPSFLNPGSGELYTLHDPCFRIPPHDPLHTFFTSMAFWKPNATGWLRTNFPGWHAFCYAAAVVSTMAAMSIDTLAQKCRFSWYDPYHQMRLNRRGEPYKMLAHFDWHLADWWRQALGANFVGYRPFLELVPTATLEGWIASGVLDEDEGPMPLACRIPRPAYDLLLSPFVSEGDMAAMASSNGYPATDVISTPNILTPRTKKTWTTVQQVGPDGNTLYWVRLGDNDLPTWKTNGIDDVAHAALTPSAHTARRFPANNTGGAGVAGDPILQGPTLFALRNAHLATTEFWRPHWCMMEPTTVAKTGVFSAGWGSQLIADGCPALCYEPVPDLLPNDAQRMTMSRPYWQLASGISSAKHLTVMGYIQGLQVSGRPPIVDRFFTGSEQVMDEDPFHVPPPSSQSTATGAVDAELA